MIDYIYMIIVIVWVALLVGFLVREMWILMFAGLIMMTVGIFTLTNNFTGVDNLATTAFSFLHIGVGFYVMMRSVEEVIKNE
jgi:hypothetical protein